MLQLFNIRKRIKIHNNEILNKRIKLENELWEVPLKEKLFVHFSIKSTESIEVVSIKQLQTTNDVVFSKPLDLKHFQLDKNSMFKCASIVQLSQPEGEHKFLKLPPMVIRWRRIGGSIENVFVDFEDRLRPIEKSIGLELKEIDHLKQGEIGELHYKLINYQNQQLSLRVDALENETFLLVGTNKRELHLGELGNVIVSYRLIPLIIGEISLPELLVQTIKEGKVVSEVRLSKRQTVLAL